jgi:hypothetical protein
MAFPDLKVIYFISGATATAFEAAQIARLEKTFRTVVVRRGDVVADTKYGTALEACDYVAGTLIPSAYTDVKSTISVPNEFGSDQLKVWPSAAGPDASDGDVIQMSAVAATISATTGLAIQTDVTTSCVWTSSDTGKATIVSGTGVLTAVAAGATTITATYTTATQVTGGAIEADNEVYTKSGHGYVTGDDVRLVSLTGGTGLTAGTTYYFRRLSADTGYLCATFADAIAGTPVAVSLDASSVVLVRAPQTATAVVTVVA